MLSKPIIMFENFFVLGSLNDCLAVTKIPKIIKKTYSSFSMLALTPLKMFSTIFLLQESRPFVSTISSMLSRNISNMKSF